MSWSKPFMYGWIAILAVLAAYEVYALVWGNHKLPPLTQVTIRYCPWYVTLSFLTWLWIHFALRYFNHNYVQDLKNGTIFKGFI